MFAVTAVEVVTGALRAFVNQPLGNAPATKIEPFTLPDAAGKPWTLPDAKQAPLVAVIFSGTLCPINNAFMPVLVKMHGDYKDKGVTFVAVNANVQDTAQEIAELTTELDGLRAGLAETEAISRRALAAAPPPAGSAGLQADA